MPNNDEGSVVPHETPSPKHTGCACAEAEAIIRKHEANLASFDRYVAGARSMAEHIIERTEALLSEYRQFNYMRETLRTSVGAPGLPGHKFLVNGAATENAAAKRMLQELRDPDLQWGSLGGSPEAALETLDTVQRVVEKLACTNVTSLETVWDVIKRCRGLEQLSSRFSLHASAGPCSLCSSRGNRKCPPKGRQSSEDVVFVDAVVNSGAAWLRIMGTDERRLLHEMAEAGWDWNVEDDSGDDGVDGDEDDEEYCDLPTADIIRQLVAAARANRHDYRPPRVHVVFTRIAEGEDMEIDRLLRKLRAIPSRGVKVQIDCSDSEFMDTPAPPLEIALRNLVAEDVSNVTRIVNLDCSLLVALASDITHSNIDIQPWHRRDVVFQIKEEAELGSSLAKALYPVLRGRRLVCTAKAAERFWEIVDTIATEAEAARAEIFLPRSGVSGKSSTDLVAQLQALSIHRVDPMLRLPIEIVPSDVPDDLTTYMEEGRIPRSAEYVLPILRDLNRVIYLWGWMDGITTMTANNSLAKQIKALVEEHRLHDDDAGPKIWVFPFTRALATKGRPADHDQRQKPSPSRPSSPTL